jgi:hypothetical protein
MLDQRLEDAGLGLPAEVTIAFKEVADKAIQACLDVEGLVDHMNKTDEGKAVRENLSRISWEQTMISIGTDSIVSNAWFSLKKSNSYQDLLDLLGATVRVYCSDSISRFFELQHSHLFQKRKPGHALVLKGKRVTALSTMILRASRVKMENEMALLSRCQSILSSSSLVATAANV